MKNSADKGKRGQESCRTDYEVYRFSRLEWVRYLSAGGLIGALVCWLCYCSFYAFPVGVLIAVLYVRAKQKELLSRRKETLLYHFKDFLTSLHAALNAGYSLENGLRCAMEDMRQLYGNKDVLTKELRAMATGLRLHRSIEELFSDLGERSHLADIQLFAELLSIAKRQGGSVGKVLQDTRQVICGKIDTQQEISKVLAAKDYERKIMSIMPAAVIVYLRLTFDGFIEQLYGNAVGVIIMTGCLLVYAGAYYLGKRMLRIG